MRRRLNIWSGKRDLNPRPSPWQGDALPLSYSRSITIGQRGGILLMREQCCQAIKWVLITGYVVTFVTIVPPCYQIVTYEYYHQVYDLFNIYFVKVCVRLANDTTYTQLYVSGSFSSFPLNFSLIYNSTTYSISRKYAYLYIVVRKLRVHMRSDD